VHDAPIDVHYGVHRTSYANSNGEIICMHAIIQHDVERNLCYGRKLSNGTITFAGQHDRPSSRRKGVNVREVKALKIALTSYVL
jgi:hypothetical protein